MTHSVNSLPEGMSMRTLPVSSCILIESAMAVVREFTLCITAISEFDSEARHALPASTKIKGTGIYILYVYSV